MSSFQNPFCNSQMNPQNTLTILRGLRQTEGRKGMGKPCSISSIGSCPTLEHFIKICYEHLEECAENFKERHQADELACDRRRRSLQQIVDQSTATSLTHGDLSNLERIQLLDLVRWGGDLIRQTRRRPLKRAPLP